MLRGSEQRAQGEEQPQHVHVHETRARGHGRDPDEPTDAARREGGVIVADEDPSHFDAMFPSAQRSDDIINTISDPSVPWQFMICIHCHEWKFIWWEFFVLLIS